MEDLFIKMSEVVNELSDRALESESPEDAKRYSDAIAELGKTIADAQVAREELKLKANEAELERLKFEEEKLNKKIDFYVTLGSVFGLPIILKLLGWIATQYILGEIMVFEQKGIFTTRAMRWVEKRVTDFLK